MVAPRFPLNVVYWPAANHTATSGRMARSYDLAPGADPYIALLIRKLQDEVRAERAAERLAHDILAAPRPETLRQEALPSSLEEPLDFEFPDGPDWSDGELPPSRPR